MVTDLIKLGKKALELFNAYIAEKPIQPALRIFVKHTTTELEISEASSRSGHSTEIIQKPDWTKIAFELMEKIKELQEFKQLNQFIAKRYKENINRIAQGSNEISQSAFWLGTFIHKLLLAKLEGTFTEDLLIEYAALFKSELELSPLEYKYAYHLNGIFIEDELIKINDNVLIRKTQKSDLDYMTDIFFDIPRRVGYFSVPSSILEIELVEKDEKKCQEYGDRIINSLRLFKVGSIYAEEMISNKKTVIWPGSTGRSWHPANYSASIKYTVKGSETNKFIEFVILMDKK